MVTGNTGLNEIAMIMRVPRLIVDFSNFNLLNITKDFFRNYKNMHGKRVLVKNWFGKSRAQKIISMGHIKYLNENRHEASELTVQ